MNGGLYSLSSHHIKVTRVRSGAGIEVPLRFVSGIDHKAKLL